MKNQSGAIVILADGAFPQRQEHLDVLRNAEMILCCDGAADKLIAETGMIPEKIIGDLDSLSAEVKKLCPDKLVHITEQESNDLAKTFRFCRENGISPTHLFGAAGGREDHLLGNLAQFAIFAKEFPALCLYTDRGHFHAFYGEAEHDDLLPGRQISFFTFDPLARLSVTGVKYPLDSLALPYWNSGTLNELTADRITVKSDTAAPVLIFFCDDLPKKI